MMFLRQREPNGIFIQTWISRRSLYGVDPYYLAESSEIGYHTEIILSGRRLNDGMGDYVASDIIKCMIKNNIQVNGSKVLILGITFKENCPDIRNTKVIDLVKKLREFEINITIYDPWANESVVQQEYGIQSFKSIPKDKYEAIVLAVAHDEFKTKLKELGYDKTIIYDLKGVLKTYS